MTHLSLSIKSPCSEKWDSFEKNGNTGYCSSCKKNVIDFTTFTDREIEEFFRKSKGNTCGRFRAIQLKTYTPPKKKRDFSTAFAFITAGILTVSNPTESEAKPTITSEVRSEVNKIQSIQIVSSSTSTGNKWTEIKGKVISNDDGLSIPGVNIIVKGATANSTTTDSDGEFSLHYHGDDDRIVLVLSFIGYITLEKEVVLSNSITNIGKTTLATDIVTLGGVVCVYPWYSPRRWWNGIRNIFN